MREKNYRICLAAPLGARHGTLVLRESEGKVDGWLNVMNAQNKFSGVLSGEGQLTITGVLQTLLSTMHYTATGTRSGRKILLNLNMDSGAQYPVSGEEFLIDDEVL